MPGTALRVLMMSHAYPPTFGGVESHVWDVSHGLLDRGHEVLVLAGADHPDRPGAVPVHRHPGLGVQSLLAARGGRPAAAPLLPELRRELAGLIRSEAAEFRPDVLHVHNGHHFAPELARGCLDLAPLPLVNSVHDRVGEHLYPEVLDWPWDLVVFASDYLRRALPTRRPAASRWLGIDLGAFRADGPRDARLDALPRPVVFHPARLLRWKGVECGVRAFARLHAELGGTLVLCASDDIVDDPAEVAAFRRELTALAAELGVGDSVRFLAFDRPRIADAYRAADLIWYPTIEEEPLGLAPLEAMACGVPLVVSRSGGMRETVTDGSTGLVVPVGDPVALADAAGTLLTDAALRGSLVRTGLQAATGFGNDAYVDWLEERYRALVGSGRSAPAVSSGAG